MLINAGVEDNSPHRSLQLPCLLLEKQGVACKQRANISAARRRRKKLMPDMVAYTAYNSLMTDAQIINDQFPLRVTHDAKMNKNEILRPRLQPLRPNGVFSVVLPWTGVGPSFRTKSNFKHCSGYDPHRWKCWCLDLFGGRRWCGELFRSWIRRKWRPALRQGKCHDFMFVLWGDTFHMWGDTYHTFLYVKYGNVHIEVFSRSCCVKFSIKLFYSKEGGYLWDSWCVLYRNFAHIVPLVFLLLQR